MVEMKLEGGKRINTENISSNGTEIRRINTKKPKILKNNVTKKLFEQNCINRKIQSEDCYRKLKHKIGNL